MKDKVDRSDLSISFAKDDGFIIWYFFNRIDFDIHVFFNFVLSFLEEKTYIRKKWRKLFSVRIFRDNFDLKQHIELLKRTSLFAFEI